MRMIGGVRDICELGEKKLRSTDCTQKYFLIIG
jgi:hypothetical protein